MSTDIAIVSIEFVFVVCRRADVGAMPSFAARTSDSRCCNSTWVSGARRCSVAFLELVASSAGKRRPCLIYLRVVLDRKTKKKKKKKVSISAGSDCIKRSFLPTPKRKHFVVIILSTKLSKVHCNQYGLPIRIVLAERAMKVLW